MSNGICDFCGVSALLSRTNKWIIIEANSIKIFFKNSNIFGLDYTDKLGFCSRRCLNDYLYRTISQSIKNNKEK
jgi:hypothetical protein